jgi:hypothetical protein
MSKAGETLTLRTFPLPLKVLVSFFLFTIGIGYLFAVTYLYLLDVEPHRKHGMGLVSDVIVKYYGKREASKLAAALTGPMAGYITATEKEQILEWIRQGAGEAEFVNIQPILKKACGNCHSPQSGLSIPPLTSYAEVSQYTKMDTGPSIKTLVRVSHVHLFGMSLIFGLTSLIFSLSETSRIFRSVLIAIPFVAIWLDIGSWWFTRYEPIFAYTIIGGGVLMGLSMASQIGISLFEMWLVSSKAEVR